MAGARFRSRSGRRPKRLVNPHSLKGRRDTWRPAGFHACSTIIESRSISQRLTAGKEKGKNVVLAFYVGLYRKVERKKRTSGLSQSDDMAKARSKTEPSVVFSEISIAYVPRQLKRRSPEKIGPSISFALSDRNPQRFVKEYASHENVQRTRKRRKKRSIMIGAQGRQDYYSSSSTKKKIKQKKEKKRRIQS